jgi:hypothetical protein
MKPNFQPSLCAAVFAAAVASAPFVAHAMGDEEFVGPFASWPNVKTSYGAAGDGVTDDTAAIQKALNALGPSNPTLYFPAGTYRITQTLTLAGQLYVNIIGQDPAVTTILWAGSSGGTMLYLNGVAYSRFDRLTFNGQGSAGVAVDQSKADGTSNYFDTGNEYADDVFQNAGIGLRCGNLDFGCAETSMLRDQFINNTVAGIMLKNANALDMFVWYSLFQNNYRGVTNFSGSGNFHVFNSIFLRSTFADISNYWSGVFNFRNNYSNGSNQFINTGGNNSFDHATIQGNTVLDTTNPISIYQADLGPVILLDNIVRSTAGVTTGPVVEVGSNSGDLFSMGNTFTVSSPTALRPGVSGHYHSVQDQVVARSTINPSPPTLPGTPPNNHRRIFEVAPGATAAQIQQAINNAAASGTLRPVVHIQPGTYNINTTLVVPANSDLQIIGDGGYSRLVWSGTGTGPVLRLLGHSKAISRDFYVSGNGKSADGIEVDNADQPGSRIFMEQVTTGSNNTTLFVDGLDYTNVELHDFTHYVQTGVSVNVTGGPSAAAGLWQGGATNIFAGVSAGNYIGYGVSNGAHVLVRDIWNDGGAGANVMANVTGASRFTFTGAAVYLPADGLLAASLNNFQGTAALLNLNTNGNVDITGNGGTGKVLGLGLAGPSATFFSNTSSPAANTEFLNGLTTANAPPGVAAVQLPEQGCCDTTFLTATLDQLRTEQPTLLAALPGGVTDARFYRVLTGSALIGIHLQAASVAPSPPPAAPTAALSANPASVNAGQSSTLSWSSTNATSCTGGGFTASGISGSAVVAPSTTTSYSIACSGSGGSATATATVTVAAPPPPPSPPTASLSANPTSVKAGKSSTLSWSSTNATSCTGGNFAASGTSGSALAKPSVTTTYSISCSGKGGSATASATVSVNGHGR